MIKFDEFKESCLKDPDVMNEYLALEPEIKIIKALLDARNSQHLTQKELSLKTGIKQSEISKIENGTRNPSIKLLQRLADGMNMTLKISFVPKNK